MEQEFWQTRWQDGQIGFHRAEPHPALADFYGQLVAAAGAQVLVPLCGKSNDLRFLADAGAAVTGVEFVEQAASDFFDDGGERPARDHVGSFKRYTAPDQRVRLLVGDFFELAPGLLPAFDAAYDRAALVAIQPEKQERYAACLLSVLKPRGKILLVGFSYDQACMAGPPFSVDEARVRELFHSAATVEKLRDDEILDRSPRMRDAGLERLREQIYLISK